MGAMPLIAIRVLDASTFMVSLLTAASGIFGALLALPLGPFIEKRTKRPTMIASDLVRALLFVSVPVASGLGYLTFTHLLVAAAGTALFGIVFGGASTAHLKDLVPQRDRTEGIGKLESTFWFFNTIGPAAGGAVVQLFGATATLVLQAAGLVMSALGISRIKKPEKPPAQLQSRNFLKEASAGFTQTYQSKVLWPLFINSTLFAGFIAWIGPLELVLLLRELALPAWQYGLALALPSIGGVLGSWFAPHFARRFGSASTLRWSSVLRGLPVLAIPFIPAGSLGFITYTLANSILLFCAGAFRPVYSSLRLQATDDAYVTRVTTAFTLASRGIAPMFALVGGLVGTVLGVRAGILAGAVLLLASCAILPWRAARRLLEENDSLARGSANGKPS